jgi:ABC-type antimicrobial peptide transport system permease subunit
VLVGTFAVLAVLVAALGVYGVMRYQVQQRIREFGIRIAIGATESDVLRLALRHAMTLAMIGILSGSALSFVLNRWLSSFLTEVTTTNVPIFITSAVLTIVLLLAAAYLPARRATQADPRLALPAD